MTEKTGAAFKRGKSDQAIGTPRIFIDAVERRFGTLDFDLAATHANSVVRGHYYSPRDDSLSQDWLSCVGNLWLNPPYGHIEPWAAKCSAELKWRKAFGFFLVPASIGSLWYEHYVRPSALVIPLLDRIPFVGMTHGYPKDLILAVYGFGFGGSVLPGWAWMEGKKRNDKRFKAAKAMEAVISL